MFSLFTAFLKQFLSLPVLKVMLELLVRIVLLVVLPQQIGNKVHSNTIIDAHANLVIVEVNIDEFHFYLCIEFFKYNSYSFWIAGSTASCVYK